MAYQSRDKQEEFVTVEKGSRGEFIRVTRITPENDGREASLDIRTMYTAVNPDTGVELRPTQKGVRMPMTTAVAVLVGALKALSPSEREEVLRGLDS
jgi:hypothetical protein